MNSKDLQVLKAAAEVLDRLAEDDRLVERLNAKGGRPYVASDELERLLLALEKSANDHLHHPRP